MSALLRTLLSASFFVLSLPGCDLAFRQQEPATQDADAEASFVEKSKEGADTFLVSLTVHSETTNQMGLTDLSGVHVAIASAEGKVPGCLLDSEGKDRVVAFRVDGMQLSALVPTSCDVAKTKIEVTTIDVNIKGLPNGVVYQFDAIDNTIRLVGKAPSESGSEAKVLSGPEGGASADESLLEATVITTPGEAVAVVEASEGASASSVEPITAAATPSEIPEPALPSEGSSEITPPSPPYEGPITDYMNCLSRLDADICNEMFPPTSGSECFGRLHWTRAECDAMFPPGTQRVECSTQWIPVGSGVAGIVMPFCTMTISSSCASGAGGKHRLYCAFDPGQGHCVLEIDQATITSTTSNLPWGETLACSFFGCPHIANTTTNSCSSAAPWMIGD